MGMVITMAFDSQGHRTEYKSVTNGAQNTWLRFLYDGYLCVQVLYSNEPYNVFKEFVWDPTEPVATRPLVFRYAPFGATTRTHRDSSTSFDIVSLNPFRFCL